MKNKVLLAVCAAVAVLFTASCGKDGDSTKSVEVNNTTILGKWVYDSMDFKLTLTGGTAEQRAAVEAEFEETKDAYSHRGQFMKGDVLNFKEEGKATYTSEGGYEQEFEWSLNGTTLTTNLIGQLQVAITNSGMTLTSVSEGTSTTAPEVSFRFDTIFILKR